MARTAKLKVFRMPIGFHDAYVAAPSQKAAIEAWGSDRDVFRRGEAEEIADPALIKEPLARPGEVIKKLRGTAEEQLAALPPNKPRKRRAAKEEPQPSPAKSKPHPKPTPRPSRAALDKAAKAVDAANAKHDAKLAELGKRESALRRERAKLEQAMAAELERVEARRDREAQTYEAALDEWRAS